MSVVFYGIFLCHYVQLMDNCMVGNCCLLPLFSFALAGSYQNNLIQLLSTPATALCLCPLSYLTEISALGEMKNAVFFFEGDMGLMKTDRRSGNVKRVPRFKIFFKIKNWLHWHCDYRERLENMFVFFITDTVESLWRLKQQAGWIRCKTDQVKICSHHFKLLWLREDGWFMQQLYDGALPRCAVTPVQTRNVPSLLSENITIHQSCLVWIELGRFC